MTYKEANKYKNLAKPVYEVLRKLEWQWTPQVGEWCLDSRKLFCLVLDVWNQNRHLRLWNFATTVVARNKGVIPVLDWETIERILEQAGYILSAECFCGTIKRDVKGVEFHKGDIYYGLVQGESHQEAVMKAVIELGKKLKCLK